MLLLLLVVQERPGGPRLWSHYLRGYRREADPVYTARTAAHELNHHSSTTTDQDQPPSAKVSQTQQQQQKKRSSHAAAALGGGGSINAKPDQQVPTRQCARSCRRAGWLAWRVLVGCRIVCVCRSRRVGRPARSSTRPCRYHPPPTHRSFLLLLRRGGRARAPTAAHRRWWLLACLLLAGQSLRGEGGAPDLLVVELPCKACFTPLEDDQDGNEDDEEQGEEDGLLTVRERAIHRSLHSGWPVGRPWRREDHLMLLLLAGRRAVCLTEGGAAVCLPVCLPRVACGCGCCCGPQGQGGGGGVLHLQTMAQVDGTDDTHTPQPLPLLLLTRSLAVWLAAVGWVVPLGALSQLSSAAEPGTLLVAVVQGDLYTLQACLEEKQRAR